MVQESIAYSIICDRCGADQSENSDCVYPTEDLAIEMVEADDWVEIDNKHYCPDCYLYDDDGKDEIVIIKP